VHRTQRTTSILTSKTSTGPKAASASPAKECSNVCASSRPPDPNFGVQFQCSTRYSTQNKANHPFASWEACLKCWQAACSPRATSQMPRREQPYHKLLHHSQRSMQPCDIFIVSSYLDPACHRASILHHAAMHSSRACIFKHTGDNMKVLTGKIAPNSLAISRQPHPNMKHTAAAMAPKTADSTSSKQCLTPNADSHQSHGHT
jgi:hypothetical protein